MGAYDTQLLGGGQAYNPLQAYAQQAAQYASQYTNQANQTLLGGQGSALDYSQGYTDQARAGLMPSQMQSYSALDRYADLLGIPRPKAGSAQVYGASQEYYNAQNQYDTMAAKKKKEYEDTLAEYQSQLAYAQEHGKKGMTDAYQGHIARLQRDYNALSAEGGELFKLKTAADTAKQKLTGMSGDFATADPMEMIKNTPGYQFALNEGVKGLDQSAAARGQLFSGSHDKAVIDYASGLAQQTYNNSVQQAMQALQLTQQSTMANSQLQQQQGQLGAGIYTNTAGQIASNQQALGTSLAGLAYGVGSSMFAAQQQQQALGQMQGITQAGGMAYNRGLGL